MYYKLTVQVSDVQGRNLVSSEWLANQLLGRYRWIDNAQFVKQSHNTLIHTLVGLCVIIAHFIHGHNCRENKIGRSCNAS
jgi:hypothetical protein